MRKKRSKRGSFTVGEKIFGVILAIIVLFPFYWIAISSFKTTDTITQPDLWPVKSTLTHYKQLLSTPAFMSGLRSSIIVAVGTIVVLLIIVILASYGLYRFEFKGKAFFNKLILLAYVFPGILLAVPVYSLMAKIQLIDSYWALIIMNVTFAAPFCVWLMNGFFAAVPKTLDEAAALDGLGKMGILFRIHIPLIKPGMPFWTDAALPGAFTDTPAVVFGPGNIEQAHSNDEFVEIKQLEQAAEIYYEMTLAVCRRDI